MKTFFISTLQKAINRYLQLDPATIEQLGTLSGKVVLFDIKTLGKFYCLPHKKGLQLTTEHDGEADTTIKGSITALFKASCAKTQIEAGQSNLDISGDIELGEKISRIFRSIDIDWEEQASKVIGDVAAHKLGNFIRSSKSFVKRSASSMRQNVSEYLQEESNQLPTRAEVEDFIKEVDTLRHAVDRLELKILYV